MHMPICHNDELNWGRIYWKNGKPISRLLIFYDDDNIYYSTMIYIYHKGVLPSGRLNDKIHALREATKQHDLTYRILILSYGS